MLRTSPDLSVCSSSKCASCSVFQDPSVSKCASSFLQRCGPLQLEMCIAVLVLRGHSCVHRVLFFRPFRLELCIVVRLALRIHSVVHRVLFFRPLQLELCIAVRAVLRIHSCVHRVLFSQPLQLEVCLVVRSALRAHSRVHNVLFSQPSSSNCSTAHHSPGTVPPPFRSWKPSLCSTRVVKD